MKPGRYLEPGRSSIASVAESAVPPNAGEVDTSVVLRALVRRWKIVAIIAAAFLLAVGIFTELQPKQYSTQTKLMIGQSRPPSESGQTDLPILNQLLAISSSQSAETYADLIQQSPVALDVINRLNLHTNVGGLLSHVVVRPVTGTSLLTIRVSWSDANTSAAIANAFADVFIERERGMVSQQAKTALKFLEQQLPEAQQHMQVARDALAAYQIRAGIADLSQQTQSDITTLANIESKQKQAELDAQQAEAQLSAVMSELGAAPATIVGSQSVTANPVVAQLQAKVSDLQVQLDAARQQYTDEHPTVVGLKTQLEEAQRELRAQPQQVAGATSSVPNPLRQSLQQQATTLEAQVAGARSQAAVLARQRAQLRPKIERLPDAARRIGDLQRTAKATESIYDALQKKYQEAMITRTTALSDVSVTQPADPTVWSKTPNLSLNLIVGGIIGLIIGVSAAFLAEFFDDRFGSEEDIEARLGLPVLSSLPALDGDWRTQQWIRPLSVEAYYRLVAAIRYSSDAPPRVVAFASPDQGDGKSTVAVNTAISMGLMGARVLLIDGDLRRGTVAAKLNVREDAGVSDYLIGAAKFTEIVKATAHEGVSVIPAGRPAPNPVVLLQSAGFDRLLKIARERFDFVIIDTPALRSIVDGVILANKAHGTVLVVTSHRSDARSVRGAVTKLRSFGSVNVIGCVLNRVKPRAQATSDYYIGAGSSPASQRAAFG